MSGWHLVVVVVCVGGAGCGRLGFDPANNDAANDAAGDPLGAFGAATLLTALSSPMNDDDPCFARSDRELYFASTRAGGAGAGDLYRARRLDDNTFAAPEPLGLSTASAEGYPSLSSTGHELWFARDSSVLVASRPSTEDLAWGAPSSAGLDAPGNPDKPGTTFADDRQMIFESQFGADRDLYLAQRISRESPWITVRPLGELNTTAVEGRPYVTADGLAVYFYSDRPGSAGEDLYVATRAALADAFGPAIRIDALATAADERDPTLTSDQRTIVFTRANDLFIATR